MQLFVLNRLGICSCLSSSAVWKQAYLYIFSVINIEQVNLQLGNEQIQLFFWS